MARRTFLMIDVVEILQHWHAGRPKLVLAASLGVDPKTVRKYVAPAEAEGIRPGDGLGLDRAGWAAKVAVWFPELVDARARSSTWPLLEARRELIASMLETNTLATVHQRLRDEHGVTVSDSSLRRYVAQVFPDRNRTAVTVLRPAVPPGEAQIDYGYLGRWLDPLANRIRRVWAFVIVLACSRHMFVRPVLTMDQAAWTEAHVEAFAFFGGVPRRLIPDNLRTGVDKPDCCPSLILPMMASFRLPMNVVRKGPVRWLRAGPWPAWWRGARCGDGAGQSAPVSEMAMRAAFSSTVGLFRANAEVSALTARLLIARG
jgi:hypothetical protein